MTIPKIIQNYFRSPWKFGRKFSYHMEMWQNILAPPFTHSPLVLCIKNDLSITLANQGIIWYWIMWHCIKSNCDIQAFDREMHSKFATGGIFGYIFCCLIQNWKTTIQKPTFLTCSTKYYSTIKAKQSYKRQFNRNRQPLLNESNYED